MDAEEAIELQSKELPCFYIGRFNYLQDRKFYIKQVTKDKALISPDLGKLDYNNCHSVGLKNLVAQEKLMERS